MKTIGVTPCLTILFIFHTAIQAQPVFYGTAGYIKVEKDITDVMVNDATSPVAAARYYTYINACAYEAVSLLSPLHNPSIKPVFKDFFYDAGNLATAGINKEVAVYLCLYLTAQRMLPSGYLLKDKIETLKKSFCTSQKTALIYDSTASFCNRLSAAMVAGAKKDGFAKLASYKRYTPVIKEGYWSPTPPLFMPPVEPYWSTLRPVVLDSAQQFKPIQPAVYSTSKTSDFYKLMMEVYNSVNKKDPETQAIAAFWDCNPFAVQQIGHVEYALKKLSPGGHWIGIAGICCNKKKLSLDNTAKLHMLLSAALHDAFIACWYQKFTTNRIRPETVINKLVDPRWRPLLQTPPFPEFVSGHSIISAAAAEVLTHFIGNNYSFADDVETEFNLPVRNFKTFRQAAAEAGISRLYGGIHYRDAIAEGAKMGKEIGDLYFSKMKIFFN